MRRHPAEPLLGEREVPINIRANGATCARQHPGRGDGRLWVPVDYLDDALAIGDQPRCRCRQRSGNLYGPGFSAGRVTYPVRRSSAGSRHEVSKGVDNHDSESRAPGKPARLVVHAAINDPCKVEVGVAALGWEGKEPFKRVVHTADRHAYPGNEEPTCLQQSSPIRSQALEEVL